MNPAATDIILLGSIAIGAVLASVSVVLTVLTLRDRHHSDQTRSKNRV